MFGWKNKSSSTTSSKGCRLKSTRSFIYFPDQILGDGATSSVYLGRNKKSGEKVAIKVFNRASYQRSGDVQDREFEVLHKLKHENIVRLLAIEDDTGTRERVLIMELCDCSVLNMLEKPEYAFGFQEDEFLGILKDITAGMMYMQDVDIVHRDIKPGNIMRRVGADKRSIFKLADFGAARELEEGEQFMSLYGTEEYLHPDMYGRALLRKTPNNPFTAKVDLWSLGVTLYHIATGNLPFRPFGGRSNKKTMYEMTSKKELGVISAVQRTSTHGRIEYSKGLTKYCHLSEGLRQLITPILAGLLESDPSKMWSFKTFFDTTQRIFAMKKIFLYVAESSQLLRLYSKPEFTLAEVQEQIAVQTDIPADSYILIHDRSLFQPDSTVKCRNYPQTTEQSPLILCHRCCNNNVSDPILPCTPPMPQAPNTGAVAQDADYSFAKKCVAGITYKIINQRVIFNIFDLQTVVAKACSAIVQSHVGKLQYHHAVMKGLRTTVETLLADKRREVSHVSSLLNAYKVHSNGNRTDLEQSCRQLDLQEQEISAQEDCLNRVDIKFQKVDRLISELLPNVFRKDPIKKWETDQKCTKADRCLERLEVYLEEAQSIFEAFKEDRRTPRLAYNDEQVHKMALQKMRDISVEATQLLHSHCEDNLKKSHVNFTKWLLSLSETRNIIDKLDEQMAPLENQLTELHTSIKQAADKWSRDIDETVAKLGTLLQNSPRQCLNQDQKAIDNDLATDCSLEDQISQYQSMSPLHVIGGEEVRVLEVSSEFKKELDRMNPDDTKDTIEQSRQLLEKLSSLTCDVKPLDLSDFEISDDEYDDLGGCTNANKF
ncbi:inhibitor of nuclear factor kappa-B kinase subunit epsilon-like [Amphiura filiformis]|uniref:inhibitor of nuclear factor kappa-B kinase subunit epsilon-like n=1 Tax=Amphiura filiformis TaxID=82378 RepID=UPI003B223054